MYQYPTLEVSSNILIIVDRILGTKIKVVFLIWRICKTLSQRQILNKHRTQGCNKHEQRLGKNREKKGTSKPTATRHPKTYSAWWL